MIDDLAINEKECILKILYHGDNDGRCAAHVINILAPPVYKLPGCFVEMNYDKEVPWDSISPNEVVYIVDFSIETKDMDRLLAITPNVVWIDHHKTAIEKYENYDKFIPGIRYDGLAGCVLTWIFMKYGNPMPARDPKELEGNVPEYIRLVGDYDTWTFKYGDRSLHFYYGLQSEDTGPKSEIWHAVMTDYEVKRVVSRGKIIGDYRKQFYKEYLAAYGYEVNFEGYKCIVLNAGQVGSMSFDSVVGKYDIMISMIWNGVQWVISLYSTTVDVSVIAKKYGGGGHVGASGLSLKELPFSKS
jgi:oligoribonuclease NrnB/cAMP/cGMP phosphodiesterase (DHH superfamily)